MVVDNSHNRILAWIAIPRTGTNFLCSLVYHHPLINSYYEIFHPQKFYSGYNTKETEIIKYINYQYSLDFTSPEDVELVRWIHQYPDRFLEVLLHFNPDRYISFKLFPEHLAKETLDSVIVRNHNIKKVLVKRNLLSTYISHQIALKTNHWNNFDTSKIKISISLAQLEKWLVEVEQWYGLFETYNNQGEADFYVLNYEDIHAYQTNIDKLNYLDRFFKSIGIQSNQCYQLPEADTIKIMSKQDKRNRLADKIINYQETIQGIKERGLMKRLGIKSKSQLLSDR